MTLKQWVHDPLILCVMTPFFKGHGDSRYLNFLHDPWLRTLFVEGQKETRGAGLALQQCCRAPQTGVSPRSHGQPR